MKYKVGDEVRVKRTNKETMYKHIEGTTVLILNNVCNDLYQVIDCVGGQWTLDEEMLEPADSKTLRMADGTIIGEFGTGGTLPTSEWSKFTFGDGSSIEEIPNEVSLPTATETKEMVERVAKELNGMLGGSFTKKEEKKMPTKFIFYVTEGTRVDKSCNGTIPTMTTTVTNGLDEVSVTCDKVDFNERQGVLEGIAQLYCKTCICCGKIFDTAEEREEHEKWHAERKKARRERYLLRKRAKEIAFEEQTQKMAKETMGEQK